MIGKDTKDSTQQLVLIPSTQVNLEFTAHQEGRRG
jgi:hypothetical protein